MRSNDAQEIALAIIASGILVTLILIAGILAERSM